MISKEKLKRWTPAIVIFGSLLLVIICIVIGVHGLKSDTDDNDDETTNIFSKEKDTRGIVTPIVGSVTLSDLQDGYNNAREANPDMSSMAILKELVPQVTVTKEGTDFSPSKIKDIEDKFPEVMIPDYFSGNFNINSTEAIPYVENINSLKSLEDFNAKTDGKSARFYLKDAYVEEALAPNLIKFSFNDGNSVIYIYFVTDCEWDFITSGDSFEVGKSYTGAITLSSSMFKCEHTEDGKECMYAYFVGGLNASVYE